MDTVIVNGTAVNDVVEVSGSAGIVKVAGLTAAVNIFGSEIDNDGPIIKTFGGDDVISATGLPAGFIGFTADGGDNMMSSLAAVETTPCWVGRATISCPAGLVLMCLTAVREQTSSSKTSFHKSTGSLVALNTGGTCAGVVMNNPCTHVPDPITLTLASETNFSKGVTQDA